MKVLLIIPAYNEEKNIVKTVGAVDKFRKSCDFELDYIVINDGSRDNTYNVCRENNINCINLIRNLGIGGAVQTGYKLASMKGYDIAVQFDGDGQHDINSLGNLIEPIITGQADFTVGSRFIKENDNFKSTAMRRLGIKILSLTLRLFARVKILDCTSGYRAASAEVIKMLAQKYPSDYPEPESLVQIKKKGFRIEEVYANMFEREDGVSSIRAWKSVYYMIKVTVAIIIAGFQKGEC
ncbi:MAG: glycosyltransferase family 2 protein [Clostridia bacterium]|nr:glycosyltransferase family 2 protein [Clostridia bacterium]